MAWNYAVEAGLKFRDFLEELDDGNLSREELIHKYSNKIEQIAKEASVTVIVDFLLKLFDWDYGYIKKGILKMVLSGGQQEVPEGVDYNVMMSAVVPAICFSFKDHPEDIKRVIKFMKAMESELDLESDLRFM